MKVILYTGPYSYNVLSLAHTYYWNCPEIGIRMGCSIITVGGFIVACWMANHLVMPDSSCEAEY